MYPCCEYTLLWSVQLLPLLSLTPLPPIPHFSTSFNTYPYFLCLHRCCILWYCWCSIILFSFPEFHRVVLLLQICSMGVFASISCVGNRKCFSLFLSPPCLYFILLYENKFLLKLFLKVCSMYDFVYDHVCFSVYVYLLDVSCIYERKHETIVFLILAYFTWHDVL
jgi:hypothetical protein